VRYHLLVVRYGELALKSSYIRKRFERILIKNISIALNRENISYSISSDWGRIYIETDYIEESIPVLKRIFGITSFSPAIKTNATIQDISNLATSFAEELISREKKFALRVTRTGEHSFSSQDIAIKVGEEIRNKTRATVDLMNPDVEIYIEVREKYAYIFKEKILGPGGLPLGSQGTVLAYINNPIALLATWYIMKRGCNVIFYTIDSMDLVRRFTEQWYIPNVSIIGGRKHLEELEELIKREECVAIITSHTLYDHPRETIEDIRRWKERFKLPILTPLLILTRGEVIDRANILGIPL